MRKDGADDVYGEVKRFNAQSAMEYLATYGWAILIIALVLAALFELGVFNSTTFAPRAAAGSCFVSRPYGPNTTNLISLEGTCENDIPKYVAEFNGEDSFISIQNNSQINSVGPFTVSFWFEPFSYPQYSAVVVAHSHDSSGYAGNWWLELYSNRLTFWVINSGGSSSTISYSNYAVNKYYFVVATFTGTQMNLFVNGQQVSSPQAVSGGMEYMPGNIWVGSGKGSAPTQPGWYLNGTISNLQVYNSSFTESDAAALYAEGIGGDPINIENLVAWYPLNGDNIDYSGNNNTVVASNNIVYTSSWAGSYTGAT